MKNTLKKMRKLGRVLVTKGEGAASYKRMQEKELRNRIVSPAPPPQKRNRIVLKVDRPMGGMCMHVCIYKHIYVTYKYVY